MSHDEQTTTLRAAAERHTRAREELHAAIHAARDAGMSLRAIAAETGLSKEWIRRITAGNEEAA